tara:strand:+ start:813 stop:1823 length:1011 start_codon:yes stop_codon:yes gene_type:complete
MEFFNKKEDVLDIQITPLGKRLMQLGQFKPKFYAFYDNDIIYDGRYANTVETQNNIQERIKDVPRLKQQVYLYSAEGKINSNTVDTDLMTYDENLFQINALNGSQTLSAENNLLREESKQRYFEMFGPLGNMSFHADAAPSWNIDFFEASLTGSVTVTTGSNSERIPNLECNSQYKFKLDKINPEALQNPRNNELLFRLEDDLFITTTPVTNDGSFLRVKPDPLFIKVLEDNTNFENENFDIEVFRILSDGTEKQLYFDPDENTAFSGTPESVEYWFELLVDSEIPDSEYCKQVKTEKLETTYTDKFIFNCDDLVNENISIDQIYNIPDNETEICD